jgi:Rrf2 family protein
MRLSPAAELAVRGVLVLAEHYGERPVTLSRICAARDLPKQYLVKIFVTPIRGKRGGYVMARDPDDVTLLEVIEAVEGPIALNFCQHDPPKCDREDCPLRGLWTELQEIVCRKLSGVTIGSCVTPQHQGRSS